MAQGLVNTARYFQIAIAALITSTISLAAEANILFEGYSKVLSKDVHIGYVISRYEFDEKKKEFKSSYFLRTNALGGNIRESLRARAKEDFSPISYVYTSVIGDRTKLIEASVTKNILKAKITEGDRIEEIERKIPNDAFFSTFLAYVLLKRQGPNNNNSTGVGLSVGSEYEYEAIAEEDAAVFKGLAKVGASTKVDGLDAFRISNEFKGSEFDTFATPKGEMLSTDSLLESIKTQLVATPDEATQGQEVSPEHLRLVFDGIPRGTVNTLYEAKHLASPAPKESSKKSGVPPGKGIIVKPEPSKKKGS